MQDFFPPTKATTVLLGNTLRHHVSNLMDMGSELGAMLGIMPRFKRDPYVHCSRSLIRLILTVAHVMNPAVLTGTPSLNSSDTTPLTSADLEAANANAVA